VRVTDGTTDCGSPISYLVLTAGTPVYTSAREQLGTVEAVLFVETEDVFEGIVVKTGDGRRLVDSAQIAEIYERCVVTNLSAEQAKALPEPAPGPPVFQADAVAGSGPSLRDRFLRLFGRGGWKERS